MGDSLLTERLKRSLRTLRTVRSEQGTSGAARVAARMLHRKTSVALRSLLSVTRNGTMRHSLAMARSSVPSQLQMAVAITGGIGDAVVIARFLRDAVAQTGPLAFDLYCPRPEAAAFVFAAVPGFRAAYHDLLFERMLAEYDLALRLNQFAVVYGDAVRWAALRAHPRFTALLRTVLKARPAVDDIVAQHPYRDNFLAQIAVFAGATRRDYLHHLAGLRYGGDALAIPCDDLAAAKFGLSPGGYVTVHNGFDPDFIVSGRRATKCYPHFGAVVARLRAARPDLTFVQVGTTTSEPIAECDRVLIGQTSLPTVAGLIAGSALHLDNEGGLVHLARCYGVRALVVFGPTPSNYFGYPDNINLDPPVCGNCWWLTRSWMEACARRYPTVRCMTEQAPELVAGRALAALGAPPPAPPRRAAAPLAEGGAA